MELNCETSETSETIVNIYLNDNNENNDNIINDNIINDNIINDTKSIITCTICIDEIILTNENTIKLECEHFYHKDCINKWLENNNNCPICREVTEYKILNNKNNINIPIRENNSLEYNICLSCFTIGIYISTIFLNPINLITLSSLISFINKNYFKTISITNSTDCDNYNDNYNDNDNDNNNDNNNDTIYPDVININDEFILLIFYLIYNFVIPVIINTKKTYIFILFYIIPFSIWYGNIIKIYLSIFKHLNIMNENNCDIISDKINQHINTSRVIFGLITGTQLILTIILTFYHYKYKTFMNNRIRPDN